MIGLRWTIGDVSPRGYDALRLSVLGARRVFGERARYVVVVNSVPVGVARERLGEVADRVDWADATGKLPDFVRERFGDGMGEGVAWKLAPLRLFPDAHEISLDNDCILWDLPAAVAAWLVSADPRATLVAADVRRAFGRFAPMLGQEPLNSGIRGLPPGYDLGQALKDVLASVEGQLDSELDEQGLQMVALRPAHVVSTDDVTVCSPLWPLQGWLGRCGAHFVGLNARKLPFDWYDRPAHEVVAEHFDGLRSTLAERVGAPRP